MSSWNLGSPVCLLSRDISLVDLSFGKASHIAGILRGSAGTLWDFMGFLMAVNAH